MLGLQCCVRAFSSRGEQSYSSLWCMDFALRWLLLLRAQALKCRLSGCGAQALVAPWHVESSQTRDRTCVPCTGRHSYPLLSTGPPGKSRNKALTLTTKSYQYRSGYLKLASSLSLMTRMSRMGRVILYLRWLRSLNSRFSNRDVSVWITRRALWVSDS